MSHRYKVGDQVRDLEGTDSDAGSIVGCVWMDEDKEFYSSERPDTVPVYLLIYDHTILIDAEILETLVSIGSSFEPKDYESKDFEFEGIKYHDFQYEDQVQLLKSFEETLE